MNRVAKILGQFFGLMAVAVFFLSPPAATAQKTTTASAGWAEVDITPPLGIALGGRGGPVTPATRILDPLFAHLLYLKDAKGTGFVLVSFDMIGLTREWGDRIRDALVRELGVEWNLVVLNCSHTHSGPYTLRSLMAGVGPAPKIETDYFDALTEKIISASRAAKKSMRPVAVEIFHGVSQIAINRRGKNREGKTAMLPSANSPIDDHVWVMKLTPLPSAAGGPEDFSTALIFSYACHPVLVYGYNFSAISADFPGVARNEIRHALGEKTHAQFVQGLAGDVRPRMVADLEHNRFRAPKPDDVRRVGQELAGAVIAATKSAGEKLTLNIAGSLDRPFFPRVTPPPPARAVFEKMRADSLAKTNSFRLAVSEYWLQRYDAGEPLARGDAWSVGLVRLADKQWLVHLGGEPVVEWREKISQWLAPRRLVPFGYAEAKSYLPTEAMLPEGGYEVLESNETRAATPAPFAVGIEKAMRESLLRQIKFIEANP